MDITKLSKEELNALSKQIENQKQILRQEEIKQRKKVAKETIKKLKEQKDVILSLIEHSRTSCSDTNVCNGYGTADYGARCPKCHLIEIFNNEWSDDEFEISFDVTITKIQ